MALVISCPDDNSVHTKCCQCIASGSRLTPIEIEKSKVKATVRDIVKHFLVDNSMMCAKFGQCIAHDLRTTHNKIQGNWTKVNVSRIQCRKIMSDNYPLTTVHKRTYNAPPTGALVKKYCPWGQIGPIPGSDIFTKKQCAKSLKSFPKLMRQRAKVFCMKHFLLNHYKYCSDLYMQRVMFIWRDASSERYRAAMALLSSLYFFFFFSVLLCCRVVNQFVLNDGQNGIQQFRVVNNCRIWHVKRLQNPVFGFIVCVLGYFSFLYYHNFIIYVQEMLYKHSIMTLEICQKIVMFVKL